MWTRFIIVTVIFCSCSPSHQVETRLYFGQLKLDGGIVSNKEWNDFVEKYVSRVFPEGSTVQDATGNWYDTAGHKLVSEPSKVLISVNKPSPALNRNIDSLRYWYKLIHHQQSVLRVDRKVKASLF